MYAASVANEDGTPNDVDHPATAGGLVTFLMTGEGQTDPPGTDGLVATADRLPVPVAPVVVAVGDSGVEVVSVQAVEGSAPGKMQVVIRLPGDLAAGDYALVVLMGDTQSQAGIRVFVTVQ